MSEVEDYIRQRAAALGMDPDKVLRVVNTEGGTKDPFRQSLVKKNGLREPSYGPFQLLIGGDGTGFREGLGNKMIRETGKDPRTDWKAGIDYGLDTAAREGWKQWYGPRDNGLPNNYGLTLASAPVGAELLRKNAQDEAAKLPVNGVAPALPAPINVENAAAPAAVDPTIGDQLGQSIFGEDLAAKLKALSAPSTDPKKPGLMDKLGTLSGAFSGTSSDAIQAANAEAANVGQPLMPSVDADISGRMQAAQQMMATLLANRKKQPMMGMTINNSGFM